MVYVWCGAVCIVILYELLFEGHNVSRDINNNITAKGHIVLISLRDVSGCKD